MKRKLLLFALLALVAADAAARSGNVAAAFGHLGVVTTGLGGRAVIFLLGFGTLLLCWVALSWLREALHLRRERHRGPPATAARPQVPEAPARASAAAPGLPG